MDYTPLIIALIVVPIIYYFVTKNIDESKDESKYVEKEPYKPFKWVSDQQWGLTIKIVRIFVPLCVFVFIIYIFITDRSPFSTYKTILVSLIALIQLYVIWYIWTDKTE